MPAVEPRARSASLPALLAILIALGTAVEVGAEWPSWLEGWLFNPNERTARGIELIDRGEAPEAVAPLSSALRLTEGRSDAQYNAGTASLEARADDAVRLLEAAAEGASDELRIDAHYNLGNARMAGHDLEGAIEAYQQTLRLDPSFKDAKFNLELARQRLQQDQQQQQEQQENDPQQDQDQEGQPDSEDGEQSDPEQDRQEPGEGDPNPQQPQDQASQDEPSENSSESDPQNAETPSPGKDPAEPQDSSGPRQNSPLPQFRDLPDMTAEEAAAILEAIENLEREQRRQQALEATKRTSRGGKDW